VDAVGSVRKISNGNVPCNSSPWGARVDDRNMSGYFRRQVIAATSASDGAAFVRVRSTVRFPSAFAQF
jgi:hypothetical protein